jgi:hypothetical protein
MVPGSHTKNGTVCLIVLNGTAQEVIEARRGHHPEFVFTYHRHSVDG